MKILLCGIFELIIFIVIIHILLTKIKLSWTRCFQSSDRGGGASWRRVYRSTERRGALHTSTGPCALLACRLAGACSHQRRCCTFSATIPIPSGKCACDYRLYVSKFMFIYNLSDDRKLLLQTYPSIIN